MDAPGRRAPSRGALPSLSTEAERSEAVAGLFSDVYAASSRHKQATMWRTILAALDKWGLAPFPASKMAIVAIGAALKAGGYASAENYLVHYRVKCERANCPFDAAMQRVHLDVVRSCKRGGGGPVKALALPLLRLGELDLDRDEPWCLGGPVGPACAMIAGAWFLTREVELATSRAKFVSLDRGSRGEDLVRWFLPASKTDIEARGVARAHGCNCEGGGRASCPFCAIKGQLARLRRLFPGRWSDDGPDLDLPLFPSVDGAAVSKDKMVATIVEAARRLHVPLATPDRSARVSGHSLRVSGAQGLARAGVDVWAIQLLGRWGSATVLEYVQEVPLELSASWASRAAREATVDDLLRSRSSTLASSSTSPFSARLAVPSALPLEAGSAEALEDALVEASSALKVEALPVSACRFVASPSGKWHRLSHSGLTGVSFGWSSACGWRFAGSLASLADVLPTGLCHKCFCARCFTEHRALLKAIA